MGVRATDIRHVALYDSVSMRPLPAPLFEGIEEADDFLEYLAEHDCNPRDLNPREFAYVHARWQRDRGQAPA